MTRDDRRAQCIEAMCETYRAAHAEELLNAQFDRPSLLEFREQLREKAMTAAFDSLSTVGARVVPVEATNHMLENGALSISSETNWSDAMSCWNAMSTAGDLTNPPETKP